MLLSSSSSLNFSASWLPHPFHFLPLQPPAACQCPRIPAYWFSGLQSTLDPKSKFSEACLQAFHPCYKPSIYYCENSISFILHLIFPEYLLRVGHCVRGWDCNSEQDSQGYDPTEETHVKLKYKGEKCCNREGGECALRPQRRTQTSDMVGQERPPVLEGSI